MELSSLLHHLNLASSEKLLPPQSLPPITDVLSELQETLVGAASDPVKTSLIGQVEHFLITADRGWLFSPASGDGGWAELRAGYVSLVSALIGCAALPPCEDDCGSLPAAAYHNVPCRAAAVCSALTALLGTLGNGGAQADLLLVVSPAVCVFAVTHFQDRPWSSSASRTAAQSLQEALLRAGGWRDSAHFLMGEGILGGVLDILQPQLTKDSWLRCEALRLVFAWTLLQVTRPSLAPHLPRLLPPSLLFNDHYRPENCILGVACLHHIVLNTPPADLRQWNQAEVVFQALFKHLFSTDAAVIQPVLSCLLDLLLVLEKPLPSSRRKPCRHDDVLRLLLTHMEAEHKVALRRVFASALPQYVERMGVAICRHLRRLERVVLGYLEVRDPPDETSRLQVLKALQNATRAAWPRMSCRADVLLRCLLKLLLDASSDSDLGDSIRRSLMSEAALCIKLLDGCCHGNLQPLLLQVDGSCCNADMLSCLATLTMSIEK